MTNTITARVGELCLTVCLCGSKTARVTIIKEGVTPEPSYMVPVEPTCSEAQYSRVGETQILDGGALRVTLQEATGALVFLRGGEPFLTCLLSTLLFAPSGEGYFTAGLRFNTAASAEFYGLGQHQDGAISHKGQTVLLKHRNTVMAMPFLLTNGGFGMLWDNSGATTVTCGEDGGILWESAQATQLCFYVFGGDTIDESTREYWRVTGPAHLLPKWALGFWQSKMRYSTQAELLQVARTYREKGYPADIIVVDFYHWTEMGDFTFDPVCWPDPQAMFEELAALHFKCMVSVWPIISEKSKNYGVFSEQGQFVRKPYGNDYRFTFFNGDHGSLYDPFNPAARQQIWKGVEPYYSMGAKIWWLDACEPDVGDESMAQSVGALVCHDGALAPRINAYPMLHQKAFYDGQVAKNPQERPLIFSRSSFPGSQRYSVTVWSGDVGHDFDALKKQIVAGINAAMSGLPFWTTDIGGFTGGAVEDPAYRELYLRWFQFGAFSPLFRVHGCRGAQCQEDLILGLTRGENEIWSFGEESEHIMVFYLRLRYRLMQYLYAYAAQTLQSGSPLMRGLMLDFMRDERTHLIKDQFMLGKDLMACPVVEAGATSRSVYLPMDTLWFDLWSGKQCACGQSVTVSAPLGQMPLFARAGAVLPLVSVKEYVAEEQTAPVDLVIFGGGDGLLPFYDDDGESFAYETGAYLSTQIKWDNATGILRFSACDTPYAKEHPLVFHVRRYEGETLPTLLEALQGGVRVVYNGREMEIQL